MTTYHKELSNLTNRAALSLSGREIQLIWSGIDSVGSGDSPSPYARA